MKSSKILSCVLISLFVMQVHGGGIKDLYTEKIKPNMPIIKVATGFGLLGLAWYTNKHAEQLVADEGGRNFVVNCATASLPVMATARR